MLLCANEWAVRGENLQTLTSCCCWVTDREHGRNQRAVSWGKGKDFKSSSRGKFNNNETQHYQKCQTNTLKTGSLQKVNKQVDRRWRQSVRMEKRNGRETENEPIEKWTQAGCGVCGWIMTRETELWSTSRDEEGQDEPPSAEFPLTQFHINLFNRRKFWKYFDKKFCF